MPDIEYRCIAKPWPTTQYKELAARVASPSGGVSMKSIAAVLPSLLAHDVPILSKLYHITPYPRCVNFTLMILDLCLWYCPSLSFTVIYRRFLLLVTWTHQDPTGRKRPWVGRPPRWNLHGTSPQQLGWRPGWTSNFKYLQIESGQFMLIPLISNVRLV